MKISGLEVLERDWNLERRGARFFKNMKKETKPQITLPVPNFLQLIDCTALQPIDQYTVFCHPSSLIKAKIAI
jgi:hypothetical protein